MSPQEWWWEADQKIATHKRVTKGAGGFSQSEWEMARRKHSEKMKARANG